MRTIRIFISSPSDVVDERDRARQVVENLRRRYAGRLELVPILWEDLPLQADMSFQQGIDLIISERGVDVAVFLFWARLGSPTGPLGTDRDGKRYRSGTEREFDLMMQARQITHAQSGCARPDVLVYTRDDEVSFEERLRGKPVREIRDLIDQKLLVESFIEEEFEDEMGSTNVRAYHTYDRPQAFATRLREHLDQLLDQFAGGSGGNPVWNIEKQGPPFLGLAAYQFEHASVFFGREDEITAARHALRRRARDGCAFLQISGASGSGKSSLARAGILPEIVGNEIDDRVAGWRYLTLTPGEIAEDLFVGLISGIAGVLPALITPSSDLQALAAALRDDPQSVIEHRLIGALDAEGGDGITKIRLVLLVDQLEELFTDRRIDSGATQDFASALEAFAGSGRIWVVAIIRSDFSHRCQEIPALVRLREGGGEIDLVPPTADAIARIIREPARFAGLRYEERGEIGLDDVLLRAATEHRELLPFLSHVLLRLSDTRTADGTLTFDSWETGMGGNLQGALAQYAERVFLELSPAAQAALPDVFSRLIALGGDDPTQPLRRYASRADVTGNPGSEELVERFVERRLFTASGQDGDQRISVVHEALMRTWERAVDWISDNQEGLRMLSNTESFRARWKASAPLPDQRDPSLLLPPGLPLAEGRSLLERSPHLIDSETKDFVRRSVQTAEAEAARSKKIRRSVIATLSVFSFLAMAGLAWALKREADAAEAEDVAIEQKEKAQEARGAADEIVTAMTTDVRWELEKFGRSHQVADLMKTAREYFRTYPPEEKSREVRRGEASAQSASTRSSLELGDGKEALSTAIKGTEIMEQLVFEFPQVSEYRRALAISYREIGQAKQLLEGTRAAAVFYKRSVDRLADLFGREPDSENARHLAMSLQSLGESERLLNGAGAALPHYEEAQRIILAERGRNSTLIGDYDLAVSHQQLGDIWIELGDAQKGLAHFEAMRVLLVRLDERDPNPRVKRSLAVTYNKLGGVKEAGGQADEALDYFSKDLAISSDLYRDEASASNARDVVSAHERVGNVMLAMQDYDRASEHYLQGHQLTTDLYKAAPDLDKLRSLAISYSKLGELAMVTRDLGAARSNFEHCNASFERLFKAEGSKENGFQLAFSHWKLGIVDLELSGMEADAGAGPRLRDARNNFIAGMGLLIDLDREGKLNQSEKARISNFEAKIELIDQRLHRLSSQRGMGE